MGLADGDLYVSGSILSFQQMKRIYQNFRAATVPSNLQAGALWSDSDDDRLWHQGTSLYEVFTEMTTLTFENLLSNSGFGVWSQSDASKGLATITYDAGAKGAGAAPSVGDAVVGGTSGATAKVISYTILTGTWDAGNATGVVTVGAISHDFAFLDNETITFGGVETAVVNMPDSAVQVGLVQNGGFAAATTGWTGTDCTLASVAGGQVGNCLQVTRTGGSVQDAYITVAGTAGKLYKFSCYVKSGTSGNEAFSVYWNGAAIISGTSSAAWVLYTATVEFVSNTTFYFRKATATGGTMLFDEATAYEITPCCTAADTAAMDTWIKDSTADIYREHSGSNVKDGSFYANKLVVTAAADYVRFPGALYDNAEWYMQFQGRTVTIGKWVKTSTASHAKLTITDSAGSTSSSFHTGGGTYEWLQVTRAINASATSVAFYVYGDIAANVDGSTIIYHCQGMLVFGSHIGSGNYAPKCQEWIYTEVPILSNAYDGLVSQSDVAYADVNIEADSDAKLPKGAKSMLVHSGLKDSGSGAAVEAGIFLRSDSTFATMSYANSVAGKTNDIEKHSVGNQGLDANGDFDIKLEATGANTLDIDMFEYHGIQVS